MESVPLMGARCSLRPLQKENVDSLLASLSDPDINQYLRFKVPEHFGRQRSIIENSTDNPNRLTLGVYLNSPENVNERGSFIGIAGFANINHYNRTATGRMIISEKVMWGQGYGTEARLLQLRYGFEHLGLRWIWGSAFAPNIGSIKLLTKAGYEEIGRRPQSWRIGDTYFHEILFGISAEKWRALETTKTDLLASSPI